MQTLRVAVVEERVKIILAKGTDLKEILDDAQRQYQSGLVKPTAVSRVEVVAYNEDGISCGEREL